MGRGQYTVHRILDIFISNIKQSYQTKKIIITNVHNQPKNLITVLS